MLNLNKNTFAGRLVEDPNVQTSSNDKQYSRITIAVNEVSGSGDDRRETTTYVDLRSYDKNLPEVCKKGDLVFFEAAYRTYTVGEGEDKQYRHYFHVREWKLVTKAKAKEEAEVVA